jgi:hypothetical protein
MTGVLARRRRTNARGESLGLPVTVTIAVALVAAVGTAFAATIRLI